jgi:hypothetical protein
MAQVVPDNDGRVEFRAQRPDAYNDFSPFQASQHGLEGGTDN